MLGSTNAAPTAPASHDGQSRTISPNGTTNWPAANVAPSKPTNARPIARTERALQATSERPVGSAAGARGPLSSRGITARARRVTAPRPRPPAARLADQPNAGTSSAEPTTPAAAPALNAEENPPTGRPRSPGPKRRPTHPIAGEKNNPAPTPAATREARRIANDGAKALASAEAARSAVPANATPRSPCRRASSPAGTCEPPAPTRNAATSNPQAPGPTPKVAPIRGSAGPMSNQL
jgi:hypothetical protein